MKYKIYAGLCGGFGGAQYIKTEEFSCEDYALLEAYTEACDCYDSCARQNGLFNEVDALEENPELSEEDLNDMYVDDRESWIDYWVEETEDNIE
jgi:hypothetical protein